MWRGIPLILCAARIKAKTLVTANALFAAGLSLGLLLSGRVVHGIQSMVTALLHESHSCSPAVLNDLRRNPVPID